MGLLVALDWFDSQNDAARLVDGLCSIVDGFKLGLPLLLSMGVRSARRLRSLCSRALWVGDMKLADIGSTMKLAARSVEGLFDAIIAHSFVGRRGALDELKEYLDSTGTKLVLVVAMSHPGSIEVYDAVLDKALKVAEELRPWGVVAPATRPSIIREARRRLPWATILAPGVGVQGARPGDALCAGADYEIVGRLITRSPDPVGEARRVLGLQREALQRCRSQA